MSLISAIKASLLRGNFGELITLIQSTSKMSDLVEIREQKILFRVKNSAWQLRAAEAYIAASRRLLPESPEFETNYAQLSILVCEQHEEWNRLARPALESLKSCNSHDLFQIAEGAISQLINNYRAHEGEKHKPLDFADVAKQSAYFEYVVHEDNGRINEIVWAVARVLNCASERIQLKNNPKNTRGESARYADLFLSLTLIASRLNGLDFLSDKTSYGEWLVEDISISPASVRFIIADERLEHAKLIGIRRSIISRLQPNRPKWAIQYQIQPFAEMAYVVALSHYLEVDENKITIPHQVITKINALLSTLRNDDDIILKSLRDIEIIADYFVAISLRIAALANEEARNLANKKERLKLRKSSIPRSLIIDLLGRVGISKHAAITAIARQISTLPAGRHLELTKFPFCQLNGEIKPMLFLADASWSSSTRSKIISHGAHGRIFGGAWEKKCEKILKEFGWKIVGSAIRVRKGNRIITDIDVLAIREGLLLVIQIKATNIDAFGAYEHWKARKIIEKGRLRRA